MKKIEVLITNGDFLKALIILRNISNFNDINVHVGAESRFAPAFLSKYCKHKLILPNAQKNPEKFVELLSYYVKKNKIDVLLPVNPFEIELILKNKGKFGDLVKIPFVNYNLFNLANDKWKFKEIIEKLKIDSPKTIRIRELRDLDNILIKYPVVIKYRKSAGSERLKFVSSDLKKNYLDVLKMKGQNEDFPIVQEYIDGENYGAGALCTNGKVKSVFIYKSLREVKLNYGSSTARISVVDKELEGKVKAVLEHLKWHGVAHFDIIKKRNKYYFLEMNPRFWLSINLTVKSGLNYPYYLCNPDSVIPNEYKEGVVCKILIPDAVVYIRRLFKNKYPFYLNAYYDDFDWKDPLPFLPLFFKSIRGKIL